MSPHAGLAHVRAAQAPGPGRRVPEDRETRRAVRPRGSMTAADARARIQEKLGVDAVADGGLGVTLPRDRWQEFARFAAGALGCRYFNWLSAGDWKDQG